jgi:hypothetical protein
MLHSLIMLVRRRSPRLLSGALRFNLDVNVDEA